MKNIVDNSANLGKRKRNAAALASANQELFDELEESAKQYKKSEETASRFKKVTSFFESMKSDQESISVAIDEIDLSQNDRAVDETSDDFIALIESIKSEGLLQRPVLTLGLEPLKPFLCVAGHRRVLAMAKLGFTHVPASAIRPTSDSNIRRMRLAENIVRENLKPIDLAEAVARLKGDFRETTSGLARVLKKSREYLTRLIKIASWPDEAKNISREYELPLVSLVKVASVKYDPETVIVEVKKLAGLTPKSVTSCHTFDQPPKHKLKIDKYFEVEKTPDNVQKEILKFLKKNKIKGWY